MKYIVDPIIEAKSQLEALEKYELGLSDIVVKFNLNSKNLQRLKFTTYRGKGSDFRLSGMEEIERPLSQVNQNLNEIQLTFTSTVNLLNNLIKKSEIKRKDLDKKIRDLSYI